VIHTQSNEIFKSVVDGGAGDQGIMFGHACRDTIELMPLAIMLSHQIVKKLQDLLKDKTLPWLRPDAKSQVTLTYENGVPVSVDKVVVSTQHDESISQADIRKVVIEKVIEPTLGDWLKVKEPDYLINPSGSFTIGGPHGDTGLTGRKIVVDTYGGSCPHGGGAFSGKDPSKVDRSAAYAARYIAKHLVASDLMDRCTVQLSYAIGVREPTSSHIESYGTHRCDLSKIVELIYDLFPVKPNQIIDAFQLRSPIYAQTAAYGHFGNETFPWEKLDDSILIKLKALAK
jgi:S-adenosylmethionine synthetase